MTPGSRTERNKREVRGRILAAAAELFDLEGVEATKVESICDRANIALRTFFNHFASKASRFLCDAVATGREQDRIGGGPPLFRAIAGGGASIDSE